MAHHDRVGWTREDAPQTDNWEDIPDPQDVPLNASTPTSLWEIVGYLGSQLVQRYPLIFWSGVWVTTLLTAGVAVTGLMNPDLSTRNPLPLAAPEEAIAPQAAVVSVEATLAPIWLFGAIAISCGFGSMLLAQRFKQQPLAPDQVNDWEERLTNQSTGFPVELADSPPPWPSDVAADLTTSDLTNYSAVSSLALQTEMQQRGDRRTLLGLQSQPTVPFLPGITHPNVTSVPGDRQPAIDDRQLVLDDPPQTQAAPRTAPGLDELKTIQQRRKKRKP